MSKDSRPLSPMDLALPAPDPPGRPRFLVFRSKFDAWQCSDVGPSLESAKRLAWDQTGCGYALSVERLAVNDEPWPSKAVLPPPEYLLRAGGLVVAVPLHVGLPKPLFLIPRCNRGFYRAAGLDQRITRKSLVRTLTRKSALKMDVGSLAFD